MSDHIPVLKEIDCSTSQLRSNINIDSNDYCKVLESLKDITFQEIQCYNLYYPNPRIEIGKYLKYNSDKNEFDNEVDYKKFLERKCQVYDRKVNGRQNIMYIQLIRENIARYCDLNREGLQKFCSDFRRMLYNSILYNKDDPESKVYVDCAKFYYEQFKLTFQRFFNKFYIKEKKTKQKRPFDPSIKIKKERKKRKVLKRNYYEDKLLKQVVNNLIYKIENEEVNNQIISIEKEVKKLEEEKNKNQKKLDSGKSIITSINKQCLTVKEKINNLDKEYSETKEKYDKLLKESDQKSFKLYTQRRRLIAERQRFHSDEKNLKIRQEKKIEDIKKFTEKIKNENKLLEVEIKKYSSELTSKSNKSKELLFKINLKKKLIENQKKSNELYLKSDINNEFKNIGINFPTRCLNPRCYRENPCKGPFFMINKCGCIVNCYHCSTEIKYCINDKCTFSKNSDGFKQSLFPYIFQNDSQICNEIDLT
jgi:hypothetical protein